MTGQILVVDDDDRLRNRLKSYLESEGFRVSAVGGGTEMRAVLTERPIDLVILDLVMPEEDGLTLTRYLRENYDLGIIILTGKGESIDRIVGLEMGADDYVSKPFELRELLARVKSVMRRIPGNANHKRQATGNRVKFAGWEFDRSTRQLTSPSGIDVSLTAAEFKLMSFFIDNAQKVLDRDKLLDAAGGRDWNPYDRSIDVHISNLRKKIEANAKKPEIIQTMRGEGYIFTAKIEPA